MEHDYEREQRRARRHESKRQRQSSPSPRCLSCGCLDIEVLIATPASQLPVWFQEKHHLAKRAAADFTVPLCRNCHAILSDWQEDWQERLLHPATSIERLAALLQGLIDWQLQRARKLTELAVRLQGWVRWLLDGMSEEPPA